MPQLARSLTTSAQYGPTALTHVFLRGPHWTVPASVIGVATHVPLLQLVPDGQTFPHRPQLAPSYIGFEQYCFWPDGSVHWVQDHARAVRTSVGATVDIRRLSTYNPAKALVARGNPGQMALISWLLNMVDKPPVEAGSAKRQSSAANEYKYGVLGDDVVKVLYLTNTETVMAFQEASTVIRSIAYIRRGFTYNTPRAFMVRGTAEQIALAEWLANELDKPGQRESSSSAHEFRLSGSTNEVVRVFFLTPTDTVTAFQNFVLDLRSATNIRNTFTYNGPRALVLRGTLNEMAWAQQLIKAQNK